MQTNTLALIIAVSFVLSYAAGVKKVHNCSCQRNGNKYIQLAEERCEKFSQYDNTTGLTHTHSCPPGLRFSVENCVCEHSQEVACDGCGRLVCEYELHHGRLEEIRDLQRTGDCLGAEKIINDVIAECVVKDPVGRMLGLLRNIAFRKTKSQCPGPLLGEGCEQLPTCMTLMVGPERKDNTPKFLCENFKEAMGCLRCVESSGCLIVEIYRNNLRDAAAELCPHLQEFICPADILT